MLSHKTLSNLVFLYHTPDITDSDSPEGFQFEESDEEQDLEDDEDEPSEQKGREIFEKTEVDDDFFSLRKMEKFLDAEDKKFESGRDNSRDDDIDYFGDIHSSSGEEMEDSDEDEVQGKSARHLKYSGYFNGLELESADNANRNHDAAGNETNVAKDESQFQKQQKLISKKISVLEGKSLEKAEWRMTGIEQ